MKNLSRNQKVISWVFQIAIAVILVWMGYLKVSGNEVSVFMFNELGIPGTRVIIGIIEIFTALFLISSNLSPVGAIVAFGTMIGALIAHTFVLGIDIAGDEGSTFLLLFVVMILSLSIMWIRRKELPLIGHTFE